MNASNIFGRGFGDVKLDLITSVFPNILESNISNSTKIENLSKLKGFSKSTAELFVNNIDNFLFFLQECNLKSKLKIVNETKVNTSHPLNGKTIVMTGFRDKQIEDKIKESGGKIGASVSKNTYIVLMKNNNEMGIKMKKAIELGILIMTIDDFTKNYF